MIRRLLGAAVIGAAVFALTACGSPTQAHTITSDGSYIIGETIAVGTLTRGPAATGAASCLYKIETADGKPFGVSQSVKDEALEGDSWFAPKSALTRMTLKPLSPGLPLLEGYRLIVQNCGQLLIG